MKMQSKDSRVPSGVSWVHCCSVNARRYGCKELTIRVCFLCYLRKPGYALHDGIRPRHLVLVVI